MAMKTINIKGKEYVPVDERIKAFYEMHESSDGFLRCAH